MIEIKSRQFQVENLFASRPLVPRVYDFDVDIVHGILDRKEDRWWIKSRLQLYQESDEDLENDEDDEKDMEVDDLDRQMEFFWINS